MQKVDKKNTREEEDNMPKDTSNKATSYIDTSNKATSYMDTSYQDMPYQDASYQDMPYQDMPYTTWKIRDTGEQKQVQTKIIVRKYLFCSRHSLLTLTWGLCILYFNGSTVKGLFGLN